MNKEKIGSFNNELIQLKDYDYKSLEMYKQRIFLDEVIEETITFNKSLNWDDTTENLFLTTTAEDLLDVYRLRSQVYTEINYQKEFSDSIPGLNFDKFDKTSAIIFHKHKNEISGTCRLIYDSKNKLPSENKFSFDNQRNNFNKIGEISRNVVRSRDKGLNLTFKYLMRGIYYALNLNKVDLSLFSIKEDDLKLFSKFGGIEVIKELNAYGEVKKKFLIVSWESEKTSTFFKKIFL